MKYLALLLSAIIGIFCTISPQSLYAQSYKEDIVSLRQDPIVAIDQMIELAQKNLEEQQNLRFLLQDYRKYRKAFMADNKNKETAIALISTAHRLKSQITRNHLEPLFDEAFLEELSFFSSIASNKTPLARP